MCGSILGVRIVRDNDSGLGKGFGYILFEVSHSVGSNIFGLVCLELVLWSTVDFFACFAQYIMGWRLFSPQSADGVALALQLHGSELSGRKVRIQRSVRNPVARKKPPAAADRRARVKKKKRVDKADKPSWLVKGKADFVGEMAKQRVSKVQQQVTCKKQVNLWVNKSKCRSDNSFPTQRNNCKSKGKNVLKGRSYKKWILMNNVIKDLFLFKKK